MGRSGRLESSPGLHKSQLVTERPLTCRRWAVLGRSSSLSLGVEETVQCSEQGT